MRVGNKEHHVKLAKEKMYAAMEEFQKGRYTVVGDLAIKAIEQAIEAAASIEGMHFHIEPRIAYANRVRWIKDRFPSTSKDIDMLWGAYGSLGYEGVDGERAEKVLEAMERILDELERKTGLRFR